MLGLAVIAPMLNAGQATLLTIVVVAALLLYLDWRNTRRQRLRETQAQTRAPRRSRSILGVLAAVIGWLWSAAFGPSPGKEPPYDPEHDPDDLDWDHDLDEEAGPPQ